MMRYARYAAAVVFALLAVGFVALWVRSYYYVEAVSGPIEKAYVFASANRGNVQFNIGYGPKYGPEKWLLRSMEIPSHDMPSAEKTWQHFGFTFLFSFKTEPHKCLVVVLPHWFLAASSLGLAALFAFKRTWRYSLRTILVATTLLAGLLGLAVYVV